MQPTELSWAWGSRTFVMGVVNVTPDSFSGDGVEDTSTAVARGLDMIRDGADMVDVGGESTRPGAAPVDAEEELRRVLPVLTALSRIRIRFSIDTRKAVVARAATELGAC